MGNAGTEKDHPRACGENRREGRRVRWKRGSPPRVRGKHLAEVEEGKAERITPARAGKTPRKSDRRAARRDHPRACGENARSRASARCEAGSPPRVRGKLLFLGVALCAHRITPARAGKTVRLFRCVPRPEDHPRACGENVNSAREAMLVGESPPRVRGKQGQQTADFLRCRITPARAGKTSPLPASAPISKDHPRACGENVLARRRSTKCFTTSACKDHPRACGENHRK